jgi:hypothetical protein
MTATLLPANYVAASGCLAALLVYLGTALQLNRQGDTTT